MNLVNARKCKDTRRVDPNYYKNNRYSAKGTTILYNARNHTGPCRTSELCQGNIYLGETLKCNHDGNNTTNPNLASNTAHPTKDGTVKNARENLFCRGIEQPGWYGKCLYKFRNDSDMFANLSNLTASISGLDGYVVDINSEYMAIADPSTNTLVIYERDTGNIFNTINELDYTGLNLPIYISIFRKI